MEVPICLRPAAFGCWGLEILVGAADWQRSVVGAKGHKLEAAGDTKIIEMNHYTSDCQINKCTVCSLKDVGLNKEEERWSWTHSTSVLFMSPAEDGIAATDSQPG